MAAQQNQIMPAGAGKLMSLGSAVEMIRSGRFLSIAGEEALLRKLPQGNWIAGTIPYFMGQDGGETTKEKLFVSEVPVLAGRPEITYYDIMSLDRICVDAPSNGFSIVVLPAFTGAHSLFARNAPGFEDMFVKPLIGWVAGIHLDDLGKNMPTVVNGMTLEFDTERAVVMHVPLPDDKFARIDIINLFTQGDGDRIRFLENGFSASDCMINGKPTNFADYLIAKKIDLKLPLVADYSGAMVNVGVKSVDKDKHAVDFYAPVFDDVEYRIAAPVPDYVTAFRENVKSHQAPVTWCCNCVLNYLYLDLEGKAIGQMTGPMTFGEIAYQLLNQTLVYMTIDG